MHWIDIKERQPLDRQKVLFCCDDGSGVKFGGYRITLDGDGKFYEFFEGSPDFINATHWMPLPTLPTFYTKSEERLLH